MDTAVVIVIVVIVLAYMYNSLAKTEEFATRRDKAADIIELFHHSQPSYLEYRRAISGNIVEYEDMLALSKAGRLNIESVSRLV